MPFRARLNPLSLVRRQTAAARFASRLPSATPPAPCPAGPGPGTLAAQQVREFGSTRARPGFVDLFLRNRKPAISSRRSAVLGALGPGQLFALVKAYDSLDGEQLTSSDIANVLLALADRSTSRAHALRKRIWADLESVHGVHPAEGMYSAMIVGCSTYGDVDEALRLTRTLYKAGGSLGEEEWAAIATGAATAPHYKDRRRLINETIETAKRVGQDTDRLFAALLAPLVSTTREARSPEFVDILAQMKASGVQQGPWVEMQLVAYYLMRGELDSAKALSQSWPRPDDIPDGDLAREVGRSVIAVEMARDNPEGVEAAIRSLPYGSDMSASVFVYLVQHRLAGLVAQGELVGAEPLLRIVDDISRSTGRDPSPSAWSRLVSNVLATSDLQTAFIVYQAARKRAPFMTADLAQQLIAKLCSPKPPHLAQAMQVYDDLVATPAWELNRRRDLEAVTGVYNTLLRACDRAEPPAPDIAMELADSARTRRVQLDPQDVTHYIVDTMSISRDHPQAYDVYTHLHPLAKKTLTHRQYTHIITKFIILDFPGSNVAPPDYVISMLEDMRNAGHEPDATILTSLLKSYASLSKKVTRNKHRLSPAEAGFAVDALTTATHDIHRLVSLDPTIQVDLPLLVSLMDALSSVNAYSEAMDVWNDIVRRRAVVTETMSPESAQAAFSTALSVALDTCGYAELNERAKRIWAWGQRHNLIDRRVWSAYIECLARLGHSDDALDVLINEMPAAGLTPTSAEVAIPVKFSWRNPKTIQHVLTRIEQGLPQHLDMAKQLTYVKSK